MNYTKFKDYPLSEALLKAIELMSYASPTPVQEQVIPAVLNRRDVIVNSKTGSGKTAAFAIPICELIDWEENKPQALVITPTRELAIQVKEDCFHIGRFKRIKAAAVFGKSPFHLQQKELKQKTHIVVGTPGRLIDHLERGTLDLSQVKYLVIDEADEMLRMGFVDQVEAILDALPVDRVTVVLSATMPEDIESLCRTYMNDPIHVAIEEEAAAESQIVQMKYAVSAADKNELLKDLIIIENPDSCIIFCNTQLMVDRVYDSLEAIGFTCDRIHGGMEQSDRLKVMEAFKRGKFRYLIATDVAARGIDIDQIGLVINYDVPNTCESYVHRIGRTGRNGHIGRAATFVTAGDSRLMEALEDYLSDEIPLAAWPDQDTVLAAETAFAEKVNADPEIKAHKGEKLSEDILKLHINAGKKTKMRPVDVVGTICAIEGVEASDVGIINILDISTYVEILHGKGEMVYEALQHKPIKGRLRRVSKADR